MGFAGGEWRGGTFFYNRSVMNVNVTNVTNVYNKTVIVNNVHTSFNGSGVVVAQPTAQEQTYAREPHTAPLATQTQHEQAASQNRQLFASENHGSPAVAATAKPGEFSGRNVTKATAAGAPYHAPTMSPKEARAPSSANRRAASPSPAKNSGSANSKSNSNNRALESGGTGNRPAGDPQHTTLRANAKPNPTPAPKPNHQQKPRQPQPKPEPKHESHEARR